MQGQGDVTPPDWAFQGLAAAIRRGLGLTLFNFDVIVPPEQAAAGPRRMFLVDINYFPGYEKLAGYENLMVGYYKETLASAAAP